MAAHQERSRPLCNRVTPTGEIVADPARGLLMGNRGCLHRPDGTLGTSRWRSKLWICCALDWKGVRRDPMPPGRWTALFFLDEATALAAGHRPCAYCRRADFLGYAEAWRRAAGLPRRPYAARMDARLHAERVDPATRRQRTRAARLGDLPPGVMVRLGPRDGPHLGAGARLDLGAGVGLHLGGTVLPWSPAGYGPARPVPAGTPVRLLTPPATVAAIAAGYRPLLHPSAGTEHDLRRLPGG